MSRANANANAKARRWLPWVVIDFFRVVSANRLALAAGLPALLAGGAAAALALYLWTMPQDLVLTRYAQKAAQSFQESDFGTAMVCFNRLIRERGPLPDYRYSQALILEKRGEKGDREMAAAIINQIAPVNRPGYPLAHMRIARSILGGNDRSPPSLRVAERHLRYALEGPESVEANSLLGKLLASTDRTEQAEPYLNKAAASQPELLMVLASLAKTRGETHKFHERLDQAARLFQKKAEADPDDIQSRYYWAGTAILNDEYAKAVAILEKGRKLTGNPNYGPILGQVFVAWSDLIGKDGKSSRIDQLALLERGLQYDPKNVELLNRLLGFLQLGGAEAERVRTMLQALLADGKASAWTHFALGVDATTQHRDDEARLHWEQAFRLDPNLAVIANNLAWVLAHAATPDLNRALDLANRAVERQPKDTRIRGTRGVVLMKLGRWSEALTDLELVLGSDPANPVVHQQLAEVYDHLGQPEMAARHRARTALKDKVESRPGGAAEPKAGGPKG